MTDKKGGGATRLLAIMLSNMMADVEEFHENVVGLKTAGPPRLLSLDRQNWAEKFLLEELDEFRSAYQADNLEDAVDALVDLVYVAVGRLLEMGVDPREAWDTVHRANMTKVRGKSPHRDSQDDAAKPADWRPPNHGPLIAAMALRASVRPALLEATAVMLERGAAYNGGSVKRDHHFPLGTTSIFDILWLKMIRMRADVESGRPIARDHLVDMINYAGFGVDILDGRPLE